MKATLGDRDGGRQITRSNVALVRDVGSGGAAVGDQAKPEIGGQRWDARGLSKWFHGIINRPPSVKSQVLPARSRRDSRGPELNFTHSGMKTGYEPAVCALP